MSFHFLLDEYPNAVRLSDGKERRVVTDYKEVLKIIRLVEEEHIFSEKEKLQMAVSFFYFDEVSEDMLEEAHIELLAFVGLYESTQEKKSSETISKIFDYQQDSGKIYSAFLQQYQIDLRKTEMHWFEFSNLLNNLNDGKPNLVEVMQIRSLSETDMVDMSPEQKTRYRKLKRQHALDKEMEVEIQKASVLDTLMGALSEK